MPLKNTKFIKYFLKKIPTSNHFFNEMNLHTLGCNLVCLFFAFVFLIANNESRIDGTTLPVPKFDWLSKEHFIFVLHAIPLMADSFLELISFHLFIIYQSMSPATCFQRTFYMYSMSLYWLLIEVSKFVFKYRFKWSQLYLKDYYHSSVMKKVPF